MAYEQPKDKRALLRVKIKSLAEEARIIRFEEKRSRQPIRDELHNHRVTVVRWEARVAQLAYGLIRGRTIERIEPLAKTEPNWKRVHELLKKYGARGADWSHIKGWAPPQQIKKPTSTTASSPGVLRRLLGVAA